MLLSIQKIFFYHPISRFYLAGLVGLGVLLSFTGLAEERLATLEAHDSFLYLKFLLLASLALIFCLLLGGVNYFLERDGLSVNHYQQNNIFPQFLNFYCATNLTAVYLFIFYVAFLFAPVLVKSDVAFWAFVYGSPVTLFYFYSFCRLLCLEKRCPWQKG